MHPNAIGTGRLDGNMLSSRHGTNGTNQIFQHRTDLKIGFCDLVPSRLDIRNVQERLNQLVQAVTLIDDRAEECLPFILNKIVFQEHVAVAADRSQRRA